MSLFSPLPPPYDPLEWQKKPFAERARMVCQAWALQGYGTPLPVYAVYVLKVIAYVAAWVWFCGRSPSLSGPGWWLQPLAFQKAIVWSLLFEVLGLGCGSGPLSGRYFPPFGGFLYFLRPGTTRLPPFQDGQRRTYFDVLLYLMLVVYAVRALLAPATMDLMPLVILVPVLGWRDRTIFLAARAEHYWVTLVCFAFAGNWIGSAKAVQLALWFWAGFSKLNRHFPTVVCVMVSNSPVLRFPWLRRALYRNYPDDLGPSRLATLMAHAGTAVELGLPLLFITLPPAIPLVVMIMLHAYIVSNVPMAVPIEWNLMVAYAGFALFGAHPDVPFTAIGPPWLAAFLGVMLVGLPLVGNLFPKFVSFLLAMRYYAGNWPFSVWLFRGESYRKLSRLKGSSRWVYDQLDRFYPHPTSVGLFGKVMGFRLMHLQGRILAPLLPKAVERLEDYEWVDGEVMAGITLGWNFGDGHLHNERLLRSIQEQCGFAPGELRCIFAESQPLLGSSIEYRIVDAATGPVEAGRLPVDDLCSRQPWAAE